MQESATTANAGTSIAAGLQHKRRKKAQHKHSQLKFLTLQVEVYILLWSRPAETDEIVTHHLSYHKYSQIQVTHVGVS